MQFWPVFNISFSNVQLILDKTKTIFVIRYSWPFMGKQISSWKFFFSQWPVFRPYIFHAHVLYREVLISLQSSALGVVISKKNTKVEAFLPRKILQEDD